MLASAGGCVRNLGREPGWGKPTTLLFDLDDGLTIPDRPVVIFFVDGLHRGTFERMLAAGELPHIRHFLVDRGVWIREAATCLPTVTYAVSTSYITGRFPGHHGVLGNKWFDPRYLELQDYTTIGTMGLVDDDIRGPTVYEMLEPEDTVAVLTQVNRGCDRFYENWMRVGVAWYFRMWRNVSMSTTARLQNTVRRANRTGRWPDLIMLYYPATDEVAHRYGIESETYREAIRTFDKEVGDACKAFEKEGFLERTLRVMVTDHGMAPVGRHVDLAKLLREKGLRVWKRRLNEQEGDYQKRCNELDEYDAVVVVDSDRFAKLTFRLSGCSWSHRPSLDELRDLLASPSSEQSTNGSPEDMVTMLCGLPAVELGAYSDRGRPETRVTVFGSGGTGVITRRTRAGTSRYRYDVRSGEDPLGYGAHESAARLCDGRFHSADEWIKAAHGSDYPDLVPQLPEMFDARRAGDLCLFARAGWDFGRTNRAGHGGLTRGETVVPMIFAGAGLPQGTTIVGPARTVSLVPTIVEHVRGLRDPELFRHFDCDSLLDILRRAGQNDASHAARH